MQDSQEVTREGVTRGAATVKMTPCAGRLFLAMLASPLIVIYMAPSSQFTADVDDAAALPGD